MRKALVLAFSLCPLGAFAQQAQPSPSSAFAGQLATALAESENNVAALQKQVADLQKKLDEAAKEAPKP